MQDFHAARDSTNVHTRVRTGHTGTGLLLLMRGVGWVRSYARRRGLCPPTPVIKLRLRNVE